MVALLVARLLVVERGEELERPGVVAGLLGAGAGVLKRASPRVLQRLGEEREALGYLREPLQDLLGHRDR